MFSGFRSLRSKYDEPAERQHQQHIWAVLPVNDALAMEMLQGQNDLCQVEAGRVLHEDAFSFKMHEQLPPTEVLQDEVELASCLEGVDQVDDEGVLDRLQYVPLSFGVGGVFLISDDGGLLQHLHGEDVTRIFARQLPDLEDFTVATPAEHSPQLKVLGASLLRSWIHGCLGQLDGLNIRGTASTLQE